MSLRTIFAAIALAILPASVAMAMDEFADHHLALQVSDNDPGTMNKVLNVAANVTRHYEDLGETVEIRIVTFNAGLHILREDTSPVLDRVKAFGASMPNVSFAACGNTIETATKKEGKAPPIVENADVVPAGVVELITLSEEGWTVLRP